MVGSLATETSGHLRRSEQCVWAPESAGDEAVKQPRYADSPNGPPRGGANDGEGGANLRSPEVGMR